MDANSIQQLLKRYRANELSEQEMAEWDRVMGSSEGRQLLQQLMEAEINQLEAPGHFDMEPWKPVLARILAMDQPAQMNAMPENTGRIYRLRKWAWAAAAVLVIVAGGTWFLWEPKTRVSPPGIVQQQEIGPAKEGAVLTLGDGKQLVLDSLGNGIVAMENGAQVMLQSGQLQYAQTRSEQKEIQYNTMTTPRGRQFRITLPDGTEVWLNAESSIRFPVAFNDSERRVEVTGEAFFHVKSMDLPAFNGRPAMKVPFVVNVNNRLDIEVLGTQFNVNAYTNEKAIHTTLTEGIVRVRTLETNHEPGQIAMLLPGQQASLAYSGSGKAQVRDADLAKVLAWKNGLFNFENVSLADAMLQLERWYDIDVTYEKNIPNIWFSGKMSRDISLPGLLKILEKTGVQFRVEGRKLVVIQGH